MLATPIVNKVKITKDQLLPHFTFLAEGRENDIWKVTITPVKATNQVTRVTIVVPSNLREGNLIIQNLGRIPDTSPLNGDDLRPLQFYAFGKGKQTFKVYLNTNQRVVVQDSILF